MVSTIGDCETPRKDSEVEREIDQLKKHTADVIDAIISLNERLKPVLRVQPPGKEEAAKEPATLTPLAEIIRQISHKISNCNKSIREIIATCEL